MKDKNSTAAKTDEKQEDNQEPTKAKVITIDDARKKVESANKSLGTLRTNKKASGDPAGTYARSIKAAKSKLKNAEAELYQLRKDAGELFYQKHSKPLIGGASLIVVGGLAIIAFTIFGSNGEESESDTDTV